MTSLASILQGRVLETTDFQLSSNSRQTRAKSSSDSRMTRAKSSVKTAETQSSANSGNTRATRRSRLMDEAKRKAGLLVKLHPQFEKEVKQFPAEVRDENEIIFIRWEGLFTTVEHCIMWNAITRSHLDLRLQNLPGDDGMFQVVPKMMFSHVYSNGSIQRRL